ncbi:hypothetical protein Tco_0646631 [Tanacetum coccineum]
MTTQNHHGVPKTEFVFSMILRKGRYADIFVYDVYSDIDAVVDEIRNYWKKILRMIQKGDPIIDDNPSVMALPNVPNTNDNLAGKASPSDPIVESMDISKSYDGAAGRSSFARCLIEVNSEADLIDVVTIGIPSLTGMISLKKLIAGKKKKRKGKAKSINGDQFAGPLNPSTSPSMLKTAKTIPKKDNFTTSNSFSALNDEEEDDEEVENVYNEIGQNVKTDESIIFQRSCWLAVLLRHLF